LAWDEKNAIASLSEVFDAVDDLATAEVQYYYRRRLTRALISSLARSAAWLLGSIGLLLPLIAGSVPDSYKELGQYGYVFLAGAACFLAANSLFGGTTGHVRFVITQLELERLITKARIEWCAFKTEATADANSTQRGFELILAYASDLHASTISETIDWSKTTLAELAKYQNSIEAKPLEKGTLKGSIAPKVEH